MYIFLLLKKCIYPFFDHKVIKYIFPTYSPITPRLRSWIPPIKPRRDTIKPKLGIILIGFMLKLVI